MTDNQLGLFSGARAKDVVARVIEFASGINTMALWSAYQEAKFPMLFIARDLGRKGWFERIAQHVIATRVPLIVDSGAFEHRACPETLDWERTFSVYDSIARRVGAAGCVELILPDVVGDQAASLNLLREWAPKIQSISRAVPAVRWLMPVQKGEVHTPAEYVAVAQKIIGVAISGVAVPSAAAAFNVRDLELLVRAPGLPPRLHFLGISRAKDKLFPLLDHLYTACPDWEVSCDAVLHRRAVGKGRFITEARRTALRGLLDDAREGYDDTEHFGCDEEVLECARKALGDEACGMSDEDLMDFACSSWGVVAQEEEMFEMFERDWRLGPQASAEASRQFVATLQPPVAIPALREAA